MRGRASSPEEEKEEVKRTARSERQEGRPEKTIQQTAPKCSAPSKEEKMKRIITIAAIMMAVAIPVTVSAQTPDYYGYDNATKTELMSWVEDAINGGTVTFDTQAHEDEFLALISDLYDARDDEDWGECVSILEDIERAAANIVNANHESMVIYLCDILELSYTSYNAVLVLTPLQRQVIEEVLQDPNPQDTSKPAPLVYHIVSDDGVACCWFVKSDIMFHLAECDYIVRQQS